jgi:crossover junction endodeoxyribonuclease RuvC
MFRILGVDPGSSATGYGIVAAQGSEFSYVTSGVIKLPRKASRYEKLRTIFTELTAVVEAHRPTHFVIEEVFYSKNPRSALVLGEVRGVAILAAAMSGLPIDEYSAREVKQSVTGNGAAHKSQINFMLGKLLCLSPPPESEDESDALAVAVCHAFKNREWTPV